MLRYTLLIRGSIELPYHIEIALIFYKRKLQLITNNITSRRTYVVLAVLWICCKPVWAQKYSSGGFWWYSSVVVPPHVSQWLSLEMI